MLILMMMMMVMSVVGSKRKRSVSFEPGSSGGGKGAAENHTSLRSSGSSKSPRFSHVGSINEKDIWRHLSEAGLNEETLKKKDKGALIAHITKLETENLKSPEISEQLQKLKVALEEEKSQILKEQMQLEADEVERNELMALPVQLKEEINILRAQQQKLLKETDALNQKKRTFEKEWDILDEKKEQLRQELEEVEAERKQIKQWLTEGEEKLKQEKAVFLEEHARDIASLQLEKEAFERYRQHQEAKLFATVNREQANLLRDIKLRRSEMEVSLEKRREELEKEFQEKEFEFQKKKDKELLYLSTQKELVQKELEEISSEKRHLECKRKDIAKNIESIRAVVEEAKEFVDEYLDASDNDRRDVKESGEDAQAHSLDKSDSQLIGKRLSFERAVDEREELGAWDKRSINPGKKRRRSDKISLSSTNECDINAAEAEQRCSPGIHKKKRQQHSTNSPQSEDNKGKGSQYNFKDTTIAAMNSSKKGFKEYKCQNGEKQDLETHLASTHDEVVLERFCYGNRKVLLGVEHEGVGLQERNSQTHAESDNEGHMSQQELLLSEEEVYTDSRIEDNSENDGKSCEGTKLEDDNELESQSLMEKLWKFITT